MIRYLPTLAAVIVSIPACSSDDSSSLDLSSTTDPARATSAISEQRLATAAPAPAAASPTVIAADVPFNDYATPYRSMFLGRKVDQDATTIYWRVLTRYGYDKKVYSAAKDGSSTLDRGYLPQSASISSALTYQRGGLYWSESDIVRFDLAKKKWEAIIAAKYPSELFLDGDYFYYTDEDELSVQHLRRFRVGSKRAVDLGKIGNEKLDIGAADSDAFYAHYDFAGGSWGHTIVRIDKSTYARTRLKQGYMLEPTVLHVDDKNVYFHDPDWYFWSIPKDGTDGTPVRLDAIPAYSSVVFSNGFVHWVDGQTPGIHRMPTAGGPETIVPTGDRIPVRLDMDASNYYYFVQKTSEAFDLVKVGTSM
ncbi:hypothetical protein [Pendulispora albinea]|uniref:DUF5050 domain-containing protein n=1 Tax=Pendulispora albinea TaxID=2741071 RepID=A0ABZ2LYQ3_9BACT